MKKQITFENRNYLQDSKAIEWILNLSKCFEIKKAKIKSYIRESKYDKKFCCKLEVEYE